MRSSSSNGRPHRAAVLRRLSSVPTELVVFVAVFPAITALAGVGLAQLIQSHRDEVAHKNALALAALADRRALRDSKLARMRKAFEPVLVAAGGLQTAAAQYFHSESGNPAADSQTILETSMTGINEARAQVWLEGENTDDVAAELQRAFRGFETIKFDGDDLKAGRDRITTVEELKQARADVNEGAERVRRLVRAHIRAVEESV
jgi:hypothetical protein